MSTAFIAEFKAEVLARYGEQKEMADAALARCDDRMFFARLRADGDEHTNSIAILVKHISGNFRSRWTDFLTSDGEKPDRHRAREFIQGEEENRAMIMQRWEEAWQILFATLEALTEADFARTVTIRGEPHTVLQAIARNLTHAAHHIGQIDLLATALR
jgi:uncharacterized damage-inducible protein DinB